MATDAQGITPVTTASPQRPLFVLLVMLGAVVLVGLGQRVVDASSAPFAWPATNWLDEYLGDAFGFESDLVFALPLFIGGALAFGFATLHLRLAHDEVWTLAPTNLARPYAVLGLLGAAVVAWITVSLMTDHFSPWFRLGFMGSIGGVALALLARDLFEHRFDWRPRWPIVLEAGFVLALVATFVELNGRDLSNWRYASIGDDAEFFQLAVRILDDSRVNWFSQRDGVGGIHPVLSSVWHAGSMQLWGRDIVGWKMGTLTAIAIAIPPYYLLVRGLFTWRTALFATAFLAASHYLFAYAHTGYDNAFSIFPTVAALACLMAGLRRGSPSLLFLAGVFAGLGFYTFHSSRVTILIMALVLLMGPDRRTALSSLRWIVPAFLATVLPLFATDGWSVLSASRDQSVLRSDEPLLQHVAENLVRSFLSFSFNPYQLHYTAGALVDTVTLAFAVCGLGLCLARLGLFGNRFIVLWFVIAVMTAGTFTLHTEVTISRLHYALPPIAALAGLAVEAVIVALTQAIRRPPTTLVLPVVTAGALAVTLFVLNERQFYGYSAEHHRTTNVTIALRSLLSPACEEQPLRSIVYMDVPEASLDPTFEFYGMARERPVQLAYRDRNLVYGGHLPLTGAGCLIVSDLTSANARALVQRMGSNGAPLERVTDLPGATINGLAVHQASGLAALPGDVWRTDFSLGTGLDGVIKAQEKDFLATLNMPRAVAPADTTINLGEPVLFVHARGRIRAYPVRLLLWHGVINDVLAGVPIVVTYDPVSGAARAFNRRVNGQVATFASAGLARNGNTLLFDRSTESLWQQLTGEAITGTLAGTELGYVKAELVSGAAIHEIAARASGQVDVAIAPEGSGLPYERNPYLHYDAPDAKPFLTIAPADERHKPLTRMLTISVNGQTVAVSYPDGEERNFSATFNVGGQDVVLFYDAGMVSELDARDIFNGRRVGGFAVFRLPVGASFTAADSSSPYFVDNSGRTWDMLGNGVATETEQQTLIPVPHYTAFWFSVAAAHPGIELAAMERQP